MSFSRVTVDSLRRFAAIYRMRHGLIDARLIIYR